MAAEPGCDLSHVWSSLHPSDVRDFRSSNKAASILRQLAAGMCDIGVRSTGSCGTIDITWKLDFFNVSSDPATNWLFGVRLTSSASEGSVGAVTAFARGIDGLVITLGISGMLSVRHRRYENSIMTYEVAAEAFADAVHDAIGRTLWMSIFETFAAANFSLKSAADDVTSGLQPSNAMFRNALENFAAAERAEAMLRTGTINGR